MSNGILSQDDNPHSFRWKTDQKNFRLSQDVEAYREYAKRVREMTALQVGAVQYKPVCIIPDIVAIDIMVKYGINIHDATFMHDTDRKNKLMSILKSDYPDLLLSKQ